VKSPLTILTPVRCLFTAVFVLRLIVLARLTQSPFLLPISGDMHFYNEWAQRILHGQMTETRAFYALPLYTYLYKLFGYNPFVPGFLQAILDGGTAVLIYKLSVKTFHKAPAISGEELSHNRVWNMFERYRGECIGILAGLGWGFFLPEEAYSAILMPTAGFIFVFWFVVWQILRKQEAPSLPILLLLGVLIGFTAMGVATILFLGPFVVAALFFKWNWTGNTRRVLLASIAPLALVFMSTGFGTDPC
jgi:hypothetical protein